MSKAHALSRDEQVRTLTCYNSTTTADGSSDKNTLIDSALIGKNDYFTGKSILILSGDAEYEHSGISSFNSSTGEIGFATKMSAQIVAGVSFRVLNTLPESLHITSGQVQLQGYDYESGEWRKVRVTASGEIALHATVADIVTAKVSGQTVIAEVSGEAVKVSGEVVTAKVSGETVIAKVSGETVSLPATQVVKVSGETVIAEVSGETVLAKVSGETVTLETPTTVKTGPIRIVTGASGGEVLHSGAIASATVRAHTSNSGNIVVGGATDRPWYEDVGSGQGIILAAAEAISMDVDDFNAIYVAAEISGEKLSFFGVN